MGARHVLWRRRELAVTEEIRDVLELIEGEIQYGRGSLPECFVRAGTQRQTQIGKLFEETGRKALSSPGMTLFDLMEETLGGELGRFLPASEYHAFLGFAAPEGYQDERMQRRALEQSRHRVEALAEKRKERLLGECRVASCLGILGGLFVILLLW